MPGVNIIFMDQERNRASLNLNLLALASEAAGWAFIDAVTLGTMVKRTLIDSTVDGSTTLPGNNFAQAGLKLRIHYTDDVTGEAGFYSIPTVDAAALTINGTDVSITEPVAMANLVADIDTNWASRDGNAITVRSAEIVTVNR